MLTGKTSPRNYRKFIHASDGAQGEVRTLAGTLTLTPRDEDNLFLDPGGASRTVTLPAEEGNAGMFFRVRNMGSLGELLNVKDDAAATIDSLDAGEWGDFYCDGAAWRLSAGSNLTSGASFDSLDVNGVIDQDVALTAAGEAQNVSVTQTSATAESEGVDLYYTQLTNARTAGEFSGFAATATSLAGDLNGVEYADFRAKTPTDGGGTVTHIGLAVESGHDYALTTPDGVPLALGSSHDATITHDGTDVIIDNTVATGKVVAQLGTDTSATEFAVKNDTGTVLWKVDGAGVLDTATKAAAATGVIEHHGTSATEGWERRVYEGTISPAAVETAVVTLPAGHIVQGVWANVESALTGGGTTVTWSIGINGDVDELGTATTDGYTSQGDDLTQNSKWTALAGVTPLSNAGDAIGLFSASTRAVVLSAAATGGASVGDTALTVGSVRIRIEFDVALPMDNA